MSLILFLCMALAEGAAATVVTTTALSMPPDASLPAESAMYYLPSYLRFASVPLGTVAVQRSEAIDACGTEFMTKRWTPYRLRVQVSDVSIVLAEPPLSYDRSRVAAGLNWWRCANGTHTRVTGPSVTALSVDTSGVYVLAAEPCPGSSLDCFVCTSADTGCDCTSPVYDDQDIAFTVVVCVLLGAARLLRFLPDAKPVPMGRTALIIANMETAALIVSVAHAIDLMIRWGNEDVATDVGLVFVVIALLLAVAAMNTRKRFWSVRLANGQAVGHETVAYLALLLDLAQLVFFALYTWLSVYARRVVRSTQIYTAFLLAVYVVACTVANYLLESQQRDSKHGRRLFVALNLISTVGSAVYALPYAGKECEYRATFSV
jgi:hypothetical protein